MDILDPEYTIDPDSLESELETIANTYLPVENLNERLIPSGLRSR